MLTLEKLKKDQLQSRKDKDTIKSLLLTTLLGEIQTQLIGSKKSEQDVVLDVLLKFIKSTKQSLDIVHTDKSLQELNILESYAPSQLTEEQIKQIIRKAIDLGNINFGMIMKYFSTNFKGCYHSKSLPKIVKDYTNTL